MGNLSREMYTHTHTSNTESTISALEGKILKINWMGLKVN